MILSDITFKWKFDYEMSPEEQTFHETFVDNFKFKMNRGLVESRLQFSYVVCIDILYFPQFRKFFIEDISLNKEVILKHLKNSHTLKDYFLWKYPKLD